MKEPREISQLKLAGQVSRHVQIEQVRLVQASGRLYPQPSETETGAVNLRQSHTAKFRQAGTDLVVELRFRLQGLRGGEGRDRLFELTASFELLYRLDRDAPIPVPQLRAFSLVNGLYNAWPYWREFVQNTAARMSLPRLVVPVFRVSRASIDKSPKEVRKSAPPAGT